MDRKDKETITVWLNEDGSLRANSVAAIPAMKTFIDQHGFEGTKRLIVSDTSHEVNRLFGGPDKSLPVLMRAKEIYGDEIG